MNRITTHRQSIVNFTRFNDGDRSGLQRSVGVRRRAEDAAGEHGGGGSGDSGVVHWALCHPSSTGQNPVPWGQVRASGPVKRSGCRDRGTGFYEKKNVKNRIEIIFVMR